MEQVTAYKSVDGKVFETAEECRKHEGNLFPIFDFSGEPCDDILKAHFVYINSIKSKEIFLKRKSFCPIDVPNRIGLWYYNSEELKWVDAEDYLSSFIKARDKIIRFINYNLTKEN